MSVHPIEYRYGRDVVRNIFSNDAKIEAMLEVEAALARAHAKVGNIPKKDALLISGKANIKDVKPARVDAIEAEINHDIMALIKALAEKCGAAGKHIHRGATSNDIIDTAQALLFKKFLKVLEEDLVKLKRSLKKQAKKHQNTVCIGRTHAQHAVPTTFGLKFAIYAAEVQRHLERLAEVRERLCVGQMTGAVGTQAAFGPKAMQIQKSVMADLKIKSVLVSNQVVQRDRHAEFMCFLALIAQTLSKIATEVRNLQRTEIGEVSEGFGKKQVGSSTMPHKRNPIYAERICGLARVVKGDAMVAFDNIPLWHERDLTNSSCERVIIPEACVLIDYILQLSINLVDNLVFDKANIERNLGMSQGRIMAEAVMIDLTEKGADRQKVHEIIREAAMTSYKKDTLFINELWKKPIIKKHYAKKELEKLLDPHNYIGTAVKQVQAVLKAT